MFILNFVLVVKFYGLYDFLTNKIITHHSTMILHFLCNHNRRHKILCNHNRQEKRKKRKREFDEEQDTGKRMMLTGGTGGTGEGTSQTMN